MQKAIQPLNNERGVVLVAAMLIMSALILLGSTAVMESTTDTKIATNYKTSATAFSIAEAGLERARGQLRTDRAAGSTLSQILAARVGPNGQLTNSANVANFYTNGSFVTDDVVYATNANFGGGRYDAYLTNDATDGVTATADTNRQVTITSFGQGPNGSLAIIQGIVKELTLPPLPGAIVLPGPNVNFQGGNSNASGVDGHAESAITLTSAASQTSVVNNLIAIGRINNYECKPNLINLTGVPCLNNEAATIDPAWNSVSGVEGLYNAFRSVADSVLTGPVALTAAQVGTTANRKIVVVNGDASLGPEDGAGILIVTGQLTLHGNFNYKGLIMCIGQGSLLRDGGGSGNIGGAIFVATTRDAAGNLLPSLGNPTFNTNGGGNSDIEYDASQLNIPINKSVFNKKSWGQL